MEHAALGTFTVIFKQIRSFWTMQLHHNRNNAQSIFGVQQIRSITQIGKFLDPIAPETLYTMLAEAADQL